jgi:hypothetical protein
MAPEAQVPVNGVLAGELDEPDEEDAGAEELEPELLEDDGAVGVSSVLFC